MAAVGDSIAVLGAGSWGTALAVELAARHRVMLWGHTPSEVDAMRAHRENRHYLPGVSFPEKLDVTLELDEAIGEASEILVVVPSHAFASVCKQLATLRPDLESLSWASKGFDPSSRRLLSQVAHELLPNADLAVISGPSFGREVAQKVPTVVTAASSDAAVAVFVQNVFVTPFFRVYTNDDMMGVELGGAVKNVIAIASGIIDGLNLGLNTRAALITRGLTEMRRLGVRLGANPHTFSGLAGMGDLILTCTGSLSRNHTVGKLIGEGKKLHDILADMKMVAEGVRTAKSVRNLSMRVNVDMPISHAVYAVLYEDLPPKEAVFQLMTRDLKDELEDIR